jgi:hypothetical protein
MCDIPFFLVMDIWDLVRVRVRASASVFVREIERSCTKSINFWIRSIRKDAHEIC